MKKEYWHDRWKSNNIKFNQEWPNELLVQYFEMLSLKKGDTVFVPLCGKSIDMLWILEQGFKVIGVDLSPIACEAFFSENKILFVTSQVGNFSVFKNENITLIAGDFFEVKSSMLDRVEAVYDRAALYALPYDLRKSYAQQLIRLMGVEAKMLLLTFSYNQNEMSGPPFSVDEQEVKSLYGASFDIKKLYDQEIKTIASHHKERGLTGMREQVYYLEPLR